MNWSNLAIATELLSSIAVLATLIYLARQTRQNTQATQANGRQMSASLDIQLLLHQADNASIFAHMHDPELNDEQKMFFDGWICAFLRSRELNWLNYRAGVLDRASWETYQSGLAMLLSIPNFAKYWSNFKPNLDSGFVLSVDELMAGIETTSTNPGISLFD